MEENEGDGFQFLAGWLALLPCCFATPQPPLSSLDSEMSAHAVHNPHILTFFKKKKKKNPSSLLRVLVFNIPRRTTVGIQKVERWDGVGRGNAQPYGFPGVSPKAEISFAD